MNDKIRLSFSLLNAADWGNWDDVYNTYLRIDTPAKTPDLQVMRDRGSEFDKYTKDYIRKYKTLPPELGEEKREHSFPGLKIVVPYKDKNDLYDLSFELDNWDKPMIDEFKCSSGKDSAEYTEDYQLDIYFLGLKLYLANIKSDLEKPKGATLYRFDPTLKNYDKSVIWFSEWRVQRAQQAIFELGPLIKSYLKERAVI